MICVTTTGRGCRTKISTQDARSAVTITDDAGKFQGMLHWKCANVDARKSRSVMPGGKYVEDSPDAYAMSQGAGRKTRDDVERPVE